MIMFKTRYQVRIVDERAPEAFQVGQPALQFSFSAFFGMPPCQYHGMFKNIAYRLFDLDRYFWRADSRMINDVYIGNADLVQFCSQVPIGSVYLRVMRHVAGYTVRRQADTDLIFANSS